MSGPAEQTPTNPTWQRFGRRTVLPVLLLLALLVVLGHLHLNDLANGYTVPRMVADDAGGFVFYDGGARDAGFFFRRTRDGRAFSKQRWVSIRGVLASAALSEDRLIALYADGKQEDWFYSIYRRRTLERLWSNEFEDPELAVELSHPRHVATLNGVVHVFGTDKEGALRVAAIGEEGTLRPLAHRLDGAAVHPGTSQAKTSTTGAFSEEEREGIPPVGQLCSAEADGRLLLVWRVPTERRSGGIPPAELRWTSFGPDGFGELKTLSVDLAAFALGNLAGVSGQAGLRLYGVLHGTRDAQIKVYDPSAEFGEVGAIPYRREGLTGGAGAVALATGTCGGREFLFAQIGATIRCTEREGQGKWGPWEDFARRPAEQTAVVFLWFGSLLFLSGLLIVQAGVIFRLRRRRLRALRARRRAQEATVARETPGEGEDPAPELTASLSERTLAFALDLVFVVVLGSLIAASIPDLAARWEASPALRLALAAWSVLLLLGYLTVFEALFAWTPGKRLLGLEVQDVAGGRPTRAALLFRNLLRIELLVPIPAIVPCVSLLVMLASRYHQRPSDLVARTVVRRASGTA